MAVGAKQLAGKKVIVKRLTAVEEMAGLDVLCSDKTGATCALNVCACSLIVGCRHSDAEPADA